MTRLIGAALGTLGRGMAALPEKPAEAMDIDPPAGGAGGVDSDAPAQQGKGQTAGGGGGGGGGGKKKKKGKK